MSGKETIPKEFMENSSFQTSVFSNPENTNQLKIFKEQMRNDLFRWCLNSIAMVQDEAKVLVEKIEPTDCWLTVMERKFEKQMKLSSDDQAISCEQWTLEGKSKQVLKVHIYQNYNDVFYPIVFPPNLIGMIKAYLDNN